MLKYTDDATCRFDVGVPMLATFLYLQNKNAKYIVGKYHANESRNDKLLNTIYSYLFLLESDAQLFSSQSHSLYTFHMGSHSFIENFHGVVSGFLKGFCIFLAYLYCTIFTLKKNESCE